jgi:DNA-directed RNA polymerase specialized sigma24 family protein
MAAVRTIWTVTPEAFDSLLYSLHADRDHAGRLYENLRRKLLEFFEARGSNTPDEHADETFDRVMRRISEGETIENPAGYCYGVAKFVWKEASRRRAKEHLELDENTLLSPVIDGHENDLDSSRELVEQRLDCLERCLDHLADETRAFIVEYYREESGVKIEQRKLLAERLSTTLNALRLRASRLRRELGKCTNKCVEEASVKNNRRPDIS